MDAHAVALIEYIIAPLTLAAIALGAWKLAGWAFFPKTDEEDEHATSYAHRRG